MAVTREQELWVLALWVEREHGEDGEWFIAQRLLHFEAEDNEDAVQLWTKVAERYVQLKAGSTGNAH